MTMRRRMERESVRTAVLTLRLTQEEMLKFRLAAMGLKKKRSRIVRERVADLICGAPPSVAAAPSPCGADGTHSS